MTRSTSLPRIVGASTLVLAAATFGRSTFQVDPPENIATLELSVLRGDSSRPTPARIYLFKNDRPFRLSPVQVLLPLRVDSFYRERLWRRPAEPIGDKAHGSTLEVTNDGESHFILLDGEARYNLPAGQYRIEAHRGFAWRPESREFTLRVGETTKLAMTLRPLEGELGQRWISGDDHIHLVRAAEDDPIFLNWLEAEDLSVGNFLQLQRQSDAAVQYGFGKTAEARRPGRAIRSGEEARSEFYGHMNLLGPEKLVRPLSVGTMYANSASPYPYPSRIFAEGRALGAAVGYAHFDGSMPHSTLPLDLVLGGVDFIEVFQFGELKAERWYQLLNAGFRVTGVAGSDFPANLPKFKPWTRAIPLLGPERTLVKATGASDSSPFQAWLDGVRRGAAIVSNGPLLDLNVEGHGPGEVVDLHAGTRTLAAKVRVVATRPIEVLELVANGRVVHTVDADGRSNHLSLDFSIPIEGSVWVAARARARREGNEPIIQAHSNPVYFLKDRRPVHIPADRQSLLERWKRDVAFYKSGALPFAEPAQREEFFAKVDEATRLLEADPRPW